MYSLLTKLDIKKSVGPDGISANFLQEIAAGITNPLTKLFNKSLERLVCFQTIPVFKSGFKIILPISVVQVVAKILEKNVAQ